MKSTTMAASFSLTLATVFSLAVGSVLPAPAQSHNSGSSISTASTSRRDRQAACGPRHNEPGSDNTITILPWTFRSGTEGARRTAAQSVEQLLNSAGFAIMPAPISEQAKADEAADAMPPASASAADIAADLPPLDQLLEAGKRCGTRYVMAARAKWHTRGVVTFLSTKTKSTCAVDIEIADTRSGTFALYVRDMTMDSTARKGILTDVAGFIPYAGFAAGMVSGGPKTPQEQHAARMAVTFALKSWIETWQQVNGHAEGNAAAVAVK